LNGAQALGLARSRGDSYYSYGFPQSDFNRTEHQRQILVALKDKAISAGVVSNPIKLGKLFDSFGNNVKTDMQAREALRLYNIMKSTPSSQIASVGLNSVNGQDLLANYTNKYGQSTLVPKAGIDDYTGIQDYLQSLVK
jgi:anionic cell wall polymer biosynthesis LytR-Cps2A-Psr (LCP) family protein